MPKRILNIVLSVVLCVSAYAPPSYAASADVVIAAVHAGITGGATQEFIVLHNNGANDVDVTDWCVMNKTNTPFVCLSSSSSSERAVLSAYSSTMVVSTAFDEVYGPGISQFVYEPTNASSGSIVGSSDRVTVRDSDGGGIDSHAWSQTTATGFMRQRLIQSLTPLTYYAGLSDWELAPVMTIAEDGLYWVTVEDEEKPDDEPEEEGSGSEVPDGETESPFALMITELLPNAAGSDEGKEFIEIHNPTNQAVTVYGLSLRVGEATQKTLPLPDFPIEPNGYAVFTNKDLNFSLVNTIGRVALLAPSGEVLVETPVYDSPKDDMVWALIEGQWQYSNIPTPGKANVPSPTVSPVVATTSTHKPCRADQYRSKETNRCRLIATASSSRTPCKPGQYRNMTTGRCRNIVVATRPAPCKEGWERNSETNRCRKIKQVVAVDHGVLAVREKSDEVSSYWLWAGMGVGAIILGYAAWEWRQDLARMWRKLSGRFFRLNG